MIRKITYILMTLAFIPIALGWVTLSVNASPQIGETAPNFSAIDIHGDDFNLADQKGKVIVLEWTNHLCPFVKKQYSTNNMQKTQKAATDNGIIWVSIVSSAPGKQGYVTPEEALKIEEEVGANATTRILDTTGEIGKLYAAKTTPHMFIISKKGTLEYAGAIDDKPSPAPKSVENAENLILKALNDLSTGRDVEISRTVPYGCSIKY